MLDLVQDHRRGMVAEKAHRVCQSALADVRSLQGDVAVSGVEVRAEEGRLPDCRGSVTSAAGKPLTAFSRSPERVRGSSMLASLTFADRKFNFRFAKPGGCGVRAAEASREGGKDLKDTKDLKDPRAAIP
jgi:hypothetical protein